MRNQFLYTLQDKVKKEKEERIKDYRPVNSMAYVDKIIANVMAQRLKALLLATILQVKMLLSKEDKS